MASQLQHPGIVPVYDEAVAVHRELIRLHPDSAPAHIALGVSLWGHGLFGKVGKEKRRDASTIE
jgi:hypothetical protein